MSDIELGAGDVVTAVCEYLAAGLDEIAVFGFELPGPEAGAPPMPGPVVVVSEAGGFTDGLPAVMDRARLDVRAYGATLDQAKRVAVLVSDRMRTLRRYAAANGVLLHPSTRSGGYIPLRETTGGWPFVLRSYLQPYDVRAVA